MTTFVNPALPVAPPVLLLGSTSARAAARPSTKTSTVTLAGTTSAPMAGSLTVLQVPMSVSDATLHAALVKMRLMSV